MKFASALDWWRANKTLAHIVPPGTGDGPEGFLIPDMLLDFTPFGHVLDFGCGTGRLAVYFWPSSYTGVDINPAAIAHCVEAYPERRFVLAGEVLPHADTALAYTVLLHVPDDELPSTLWRLSSAAPRVLVVEILGRKWRREGEPATFNRSRYDYEMAFRDHAGMDLVTALEYPYKRYGGVSITAMDFRRGPIRHTP